MRVVSSNPAVQTYVWFASFWLESVFHHGMGEQYMLKDNYKAMTFALLIPIGLYFEPIDWLETKYSIYFFGFVAIRILFELARLSIAKLKGKPPHLYATGQPFKLWRYLFPNLSVVSRIIEPAIALTIGAILVTTQTDEILGYVLIWAALGMVHKFYTIDRENRINREDVESRKGEV